MVTVKKIIPTRNRKKMQIKDHKRKMDKAQQKQKPRIFVFLFRPSLFPKRKEATVRKNC